jgi:hypothetical protein
VHPTPAGAVILSPAMIVVPAGGAAGRASLRLRPERGNHHGAHDYRLVQRWYRCYWRVIILLAGFLLGLGCGLSASKWQRDERAPDALFRPPDGPSPPDHP